jgi:protein phosphatase
MVAIESAGLTDVGKKRTANEDAFYLDDNQHLYVVADGMGGHRAGEVASELVINTIRDYMKRFQKEERPEELEDIDETLSKEANRLLAGIRLANQGVHHVARSKRSYHGMGSTVSAAYFTDDTLITANVGDSPIYLVHNGQIELLSVTHNVITEQAAIDPEAARQIGKQYQHLLTRAVGIEEAVKPDSCELQFFQGDIVVISSDGLSDKVNPQEILKVVTRERPDKACRTLIEMANHRGGDDNITVIALRVNSGREVNVGVLGRIAKLMHPLKKIFK